MAYNDNDISVLKGALDGPLYAFTTEVDPADFDADFEPSVFGGVKLGEISSDGIDSNEAADSNEVKVFSGRIVRNSYSNWTDELVTRLYSRLDVDVARIFYGAENVTVSNGIVKTAVGLRQPPIISLFAKTVADDGSEFWFFASKVQADINKSETWNETDIVELEITWKCLADSLGKSHYTLHIPASSGS